MMSFSGNSVRAAAAAVALMLVLAGCGGGGASAPASNAVGANPPSNPPVVTQEITGVATPSSVAVVTATNAQ